MNAQAPRTTCHRAISAYDEQHDRELLDAILTAIAEASRVSDGNAIVIRTGEIASALLTALASILAMSPAATRSPTAIRKTMDELGERLRGRLAAAERSPEMQAFVASVFNGTDAGGSA